MDSPENKLLNVDITNYSGSLEVLLNLAKSQKVDLLQISVTQLADQFIEYINLSKKVNLDLASEYLLMATWLTYLKSKLLLPQDEEAEFEAREVAERLKIQLKKLELIRLLSDQLNKKNRLGLEVRMRGMSGGIRKKTKSKYEVSLYDLLKSYSNHVMKKNFLSINIPKLPVCTTDHAILIIKNNLKKISQWKNISVFIPKKFKTTKKLKRTGLAGFFAASLELTKEGVVSIMQKEKFGKLLIKERNEK